MSNILPEASWLSPGSKAAYRSIRPSLLEDPVTPVRRNNHPSSNNYHSGLDPNGSIGPERKGCDAFYGGEDGSSGRGTLEALAAYSFKEFPPNELESAEVEDDSVPKTVTLPRAQFLDLCLRAHLLDSFHPEIYSQDLLQGRPSRYAKEGPDPEESPAPKDIQDSNISVIRGRNTISHDPPEPMEQHGNNQKHPPAVDRTVIIAPLPLELKIRDFIHSIIAPGGLRHIHFAPLPGVDFQVGCITFMSAKGAEAYLKYTQEHGFFLSMRAEGEHHDMDDTSGETRTVIMQSLNDGRGGVKKVTLVKKHLDRVRVRMWGKHFDGTPLDVFHNLHLAYEHTLLVWFRLDDTWFCKDLEGEILRNGATRQLKVLGHVDDVLEELEMIRFSPLEYSGGGVSLEFVNYFTGVRGGKDCMKLSDQRSAVMLRFFSLHHAIMAKRYFDMRKGYESRSFYVRDYADREVETLKWHTYPKVGESGEAKRELLRQIDPDFGFETPQRRGNSDEYGLEQEEGVSEGGFDS
ncbi:hypothetical protein FN846DRAFT_933605 [Sphaerosporella brunnea]|uniref:Uncharacterized protein n=1 Tax=Sphaerosporella brunnea TaxID=1250544 RepID=A0A5J5F6K1_9PEZI|nr:hypothetical protein FN846DRAFT_933605 [Sphaerosporella brunnea]